MQQSMWMVAALIVLSGCAQTERADETPLPNAYFEHPAQTAGALESVDPEAYPETPGFTDSERPPTSGVEGLGPPR